MVVAVDGTRPAQVAGRRLPRLLRGALVAIGLSGLIWLLGLLIGSGTAAAETEPNQPAGLLGGLVGGLTNTLGNVLDTTTSTVGQLTGGVVDTPVVTPASPPVAVPESPQPQPEPVQIAKPRSVPHASVPASSAAKPRLAPSAPAATPVVHKAVAPAPVAVKRPVEPMIGNERANPSGPAPAPGKAPSVPAAPAVPTGSVSAGHDGPGQARGSHGVLAGQATLEPPAEAFTTHGHAANTGDPAVGLPAAAPD